ncbi:TIGR00730 family Rossman fold protein [Hoeflea prorocentri]|uniref:Cytokinin riboside 5'-monophosphate phosphoribohydrolase n=1 Tax=Hoeflea prorocentri TaxID=1922333 RepID=A0A9X3UIH5_9HYPH|nr:TIGR00730 family Rossman fold protein [Hoeflea prorocentri]MCY6381430.1 TIGR00730 family Rossman fold protein [Hoeflea prorocentri]MDA5399230.1 TIGR00730 family Rossman fold protein [Hoeflea prorocentri]
MTEIRSICVYCGSQPGNDPQFDNAARVLGQSIAANDIRLVYGGGTQGLMGTVAEAVIGGKGLVTGIIPEFLQSREAGNGKKLTFDEHIVTKDMHERKHAMFEKSGAFVALPGGIGTLEEIIEIMTWSQLGRHRRPMVLANMAGFWNPLLDLLNHMAHAGFLHTAHLARPLVATNVEQIVPMIMAEWEKGDVGAGDQAVIDRM